MEVYQARLDTFQKSRRLKQPNAKRAVTVKWPHADADLLATPDALAEAGFFWNPTVDDHDNVACFMCGKELGSWEPEDDPLAVHFDKCADECAWAMLRCGLPLDQDRKGSFVFKNASRHPMSKAMEKSRLVTFKASGRWPYDSVKGHSASSTKMAKAGFVYTPQSSGDDTSTCLYCGLSLSGWNDGDDPLDLHRAGEADYGPCPFFSDPPTLGKSTLGRSTSARASSAKPRASSAKSRTRGGSRQPQPATVSDSSSSDEPAPAPPKRARTTSATTVTSDVGSLRRSTRRAPTVDLDDAQDGGAEFGRMPGGSGGELGRSTRGKKTARAPAGRIEAIAEAEESEGDEERAPTAVKGKKTAGKSGSRKGKEKKESEEEAEVVEEEEEQPKPKKGTKKSKAKVAMEVEVKVEDEDPPPAPAPIKPRAKKPASTRTPAPPPPEEGEGSEDNEDDPPIKTRTRKPSSAAKSKAAAQEALARARSSSKRKLPSPVPEDGSEEDELSRVPPQAADGKHKAKVKKPLPPVPASAEVSDAEMRTAEEDEEPPEPVRLVKAKPREGSRAPTVERRTSPVPAPAPRSRTATASSATSKAPPSAASSLPPARTRVVSGASDASQASRKGKAPAAIPTVPEEPMSVDDDDPPPPPASSLKPARAVEVLLPAPKHGGALLSPSPARPPRSPQRPAPQPAFSPRRDAHRPTARPESPVEDVPSPAHMPSTPPRAPSSPFPQPPPSSSIPSLRSLASHSSSATLNGNVNGDGDGEAGEGPLSAADRALTVEEWIRREMDVQHERMRLDGEALIRAFKQRAEETRAQIQAM